MNGFENEILNEPLDENLNDDMKNNICESFKKLASHIKNGEKLVALTSFAIFVYDEKENAMKSTDGKYVLPIYDKTLYTYANDMFIACIIKFDDTDLLLDYINKNTYKEDYKKYLNHVTANDIQMF